MSIDARIAAVTVITGEYCDVCNGDGKDPEDNWDDCPVCHGATKTNPRVRLNLEPREVGGVAGQPVLTIVNPPTTDALVLAGMVGTEIWGGGSEIMVGDRKWANRIGYTQIELC
jgi:hypothetical protein